MNYVYPLLVAAGGALAVDFRERIAVATGVMLFLAVAARSGLLHTLPLPAALSTSNEGEPAR